MQGKEQRSLQAKRDLCGTEKLKRLRNKVPESYKTYYLECPNLHKLTFIQYVSEKGKTLSHPPVACLSCCTSLKVVKTNSERFLCNDRSQD